MIIKRNYTELNFNVTEKRAPTDESVRLLREMEKEALNQISSIDPVTSRSRQNSSMLRSTRILNRVSYA